MYWFPAVATGEFGLTAGLPTNKNPQRIYVGGSQSRGRAGLSPPYITSLRGQRRVF
jgi:hypothetical protein